MNFAPKSILSSLAFFCCIGLISCTSQDESKLEKLQPVEGDTIEVTGICDTEENYESCPITNIPKYLRQSVALDQDHKYRKGSGQTPETINSFVILKHIKSGFLIDDYIGYKFLKGRGNPGDIPLATTVSEIHPDATIYEVFTNNFDLKYQRALNLGKPVEIFNHKPSCYFQKYYRSDELVVVIVQEKQPDYSDLTPKSARKIKLKEVREKGLNCSAYGHLYYFGINTKQLTSKNDFYTFGNGISTEVVFDKERIVNSLKDLD